MHREHATVIARSVALVLVYLGCRKRPPLPLKREPDGSLRVSTTQLVEGRHIDWLALDVERAITRPKALKALLEIAAENELVFEYDKGVFTVRRLS